MLEVEDIIRKLKLVNAYNEITRANKIKEIIITFKKQLTMNKIKNSMSYQKKIFGSLKRFTFKVDSYTRCS